MKISHQKYPHTTQTTMAKISIILLGSYGERSLMVLRNLHDRLRNEGFKHSYLVEDFDTPKRREDEDEDAYLTRKSLYWIEPGAVYTALRRMEHRGLLTSKWEEKETGPDRRTYTITPEGKRVLKQGLEMMKLQRAVLDDLANYYDAHYKQ